MHSMHSYLKNYPAKFHPDPILNDRALGFFCTGRFSKNKMSGDTRSVCDLKIVMPYTVTVIINIIIIMYLT